MQEKDKKMEKNKGIEKDRGECKLHKTKRKYNYVWGGGEDPDNR